MLKHFTSIVTNIILYNYIVPQVSLNKLNCINSQIPRVGDTELAEGIGIELSVETNTNL